MQMNLLGRTGLDVSVLSFGGAAVGQQYGPVSTAEVSDALYAAADAGINLIDTSAFYGLGKSEEILGEVLTPALRKQFAICTKAGRLDRAKFDFSAAGMRACFEGSLKRLKTDHVDILLAHDIEFADDYEQVFTETADVLHALKKEGKCRFIGMSGYPLGLLKQAIERCQLDVIISYCHFHLQDQTLLTDLLPTCERLGVGVLNASPLAMGLHTNQGPPPWHPADAEIKAACRAAAEHCARHGGNISELGMQFCLAEPRIPSTITGTAKRSELEINLKTLGTPPDPVLLAEVQAILAPVRNRTWPSGNWQR
jgi:L-galactose dehydrogenase